MFLPDESISEYEDDESIDRIYTIADNRFDIPSWFDSDESEFLTPGAVKQDEGGDEDVSFIKDLPSDAFTDDATIEVILLSPDRNPTKVVDREYLLSDKSDLIRDAATLLQNTLRKLSPIVFTQQPNLSKIVVENVKSDGHLQDGKVIWTVELSAANQPGIYRTQQSTPTKKTRIEIPMVVKEGILLPPMVMTTASNKMFPLTVEGCQILLHWKKGPVIRKRMPQVERSWQVERDYRAF